ncbi:MAG: hypothetical protein WBW84_04295 [Acidobacteriaceae bacterium]
MLKFLLAILLLPTAPALVAQVLARHPFATELTRALALEAGATATDIPHHVHYDLKLYDRHHKLTTGTWDIWRDPQHYVRTDIVAGDFHYTDIDDLAQHRQWRHFDHVLPLKIFDLRQNYEKPEAPVEFFSDHALNPDPMVTFQQVEGSPFDCTSELLEMRICFDPIAHVLAFAQIMNQTVTWEDWQPLGTHSVPRRFRIFDGNRMIVEASGKAEKVKTFPPNLFAIPAGEPDMGEPEDDGGVPHRVVSMKPIHLDFLYGNVLMHLFVEPDGKVRKAEVVDADDNDLIGDVKHFSRNLKFAPQMKNGVAVPFEQYLYVQDSINFSGPDQSGSSSTRSPSAAAR